ncbi:hypothetical protein ACS0TY_006765 [Phlomoides rotata]
MTPIQVEKAAILLTTTAIRRTTTMIQVETTAILPTMMAIQRTTTISGRNRTTTTTLGRTTPTKKVFPQVFANAWKKA